MARVPFGVSRLDSMIGGGAPTGSTVLLASEVGAGGREFLYTTAAMSGLAHADEELFDLYYGDLEGTARLPDSVQYLSFTDDRNAIVEEMEYTMDAELVDAATDAISFEDLSEEYFQLSQVPSDWYAGTTPDITALGDRHDRRDVLDAIGEYLTREGEGSLVVIDSVTDLISVASGEMDWTDITLLIKGLTKAAKKWGGMVVLLVTLETLEDTELGRLMEATDGTLLFEWETGGSERARTMVVKQFRGVLSRLEEEEIIRFETEIHDGGFDISDVRKIR
ncbi:RecA-superfamily ATPase possibly involved in signal transduction [Salinarchaeum sp. Harcht-Bsk1]|uniref:RAD55 family ATPase n=1 Tax=Salinarchaeum sp. Harcht-Bsk1 TaxID=1333523 RepID=UPI00034228B2|nr:RecA superfamily ATPase [Salinarchaeum sp. Harcht-Bsk1]AGN02792.1 RecA-superfamily ATPase possibly involved in signal transduction [Salinarchaeum sp. Harcht-Bsk1]